MGSIYANCVCTIDALDSRDSKGGYTKRSPLSFTSCKILTRSDNMRYLTSPQAERSRSRLNPDNSDLSTFSETKAEVAILLTRGCVV